jgi:hypothetical protein
MVVIYAKASRVLVWLGEAVDDSDEAIEIIHTYAVQGSEVTHPNDYCVLKLLQRPWFQRIWVKKPPCQTKFGKGKLMCPGSSRSCRRSSCTDAMRPFRD